MSSSEPWSGKNLVFVGGMHRSGTTVLAGILSNADDASGLDRSGAHMGEGQFLQDVYPVDKEYGGVTRWAFDSRSHLTEADVAADTARRLWDAWSPWWGSEAQHLIEKSPLNLVRTRFLAKAFPQARFVIVTRHPVAQALAVHKWSPTRLGKAGFQFNRLVEHWCVAHRTAFDDLRAVENVRVVRFEHLVARPHEELGRITDFLGMTLPPGAADRLEPGVLELYAAMWDNARSGRGVQYTGRSPKKVVRRAIARRVFVPEARRVQAYADVVAELGYDIDDLSHARAWSPTQDPREERA